MAITISGDSPSFASYQGGVVTSGTAVASTSGTSIDFTSIPSWVKRVTVMLSGVSTNGTSNIQIQIGTGGSPTTSGYLGAVSYIAGTSTSSTNFTTGFGITNAVGATHIYHGLIIISLLDSSANRWAYSSSVARSDTTVNYMGAGSVALSGVLNLVRVTTANGTDAFDAGSINILYE